MSEILLIILGIGIIYAIFDAIVFIQAVQYGIVWRFGGQTKGYLDEGLNLKIPFIDKVKVASLELKTKEITVVFTSKDNLRLTIPGSLQYRADKRVMDEEGKNVFVRISEEAITTGIEKDIQAKLGGIGSKYEGEEFIKNRQALSDIINSIIRLTSPLHLHHIPNDPENCGLTDCKHGAGKIDVKNLIEFYNAHWPRIKEILAYEKDHPEVRADIEQRYGIDISTYSLAQVDFTKETQAAQEEKRQAGYRKEAGQTVIELAKSAKTDLDGVSGQQALNWADSILNPETPRQMISVEGDVGIAGGLLGLVSKKKP